jgi:hypothetical protein
VQLHPGLGDVLFEMLTRRLLANLLHTSRVFAELCPVERRGITLTGQVELRIPGGPARVEGAGMMFGHASMLEGGAAWPAFAPSIPCWC